MTRVLQFKHETATLNLTNWEDGTASVSDVYTVERRKGHATKLLTKVVEFADRRGLILKTAAEAYGVEPRMTTDQLVSFYSKFGFVLLSDDPDYRYMERKPLRSQALQVL